jgi:hypothetical protein
MFSLLSGHQSQSRSAIKLQVEAQHLPSKAEVTQDL